MVKHCCVHVPNCACVHSINIKYTYQLSETSTGMLCVHILIVIARIRNYDLSFHEATVWCTCFLPVSCKGVGGGGWRFLWKPAPSHRCGDVVR